jgi:hypothetical protein
VLPFVNVSVTNAEPEVTEPLASLFDQTVVAEAVHEWRSDLNPGLARRLSLIAAAALSEAIKDAQPRRDARRRAFLMGSSVE